MSNYAVSIVVPVYNAEKYLSKCIDSILNQTFKNFELILVNDGSKDNSLIICEDYKVSDRRIKVINKKNEGVSIARNIGINSAKGKYIMFIDSDDWIESNMVEKMYDAIQNSDIAVCGSKTVEKNKIIDNTLYQSFTKEKNLIGKEIINLINRVQHRCVWNKIYKISILKKNNIMFNEEIKCGEDSIFNFTYFKYINSIKIIPDSLYNYNRIVTDSITLRYLPKRAKYENLMLQSLISLLSDYNILETNVELINNYQFEGIYQSLISINHPECPYSLLQRYNHMKNLIRKYTFYNQKIYSKNIKEFSKITKLVILSKRPILLSIYSLLIR